VSARAGAAILLHIPLEGANYLLEVQDQSPTLLVGFHPTDAAKQAGAKPFQGDFGTKVNGSITAGTTLDLVIRTRRAGVSISIGGKLVFQRNGFDGVAHREQTTTLGVNSIKDVLLIRRFEVTELPANGSDQLPSKPIDAETPDPAPTTTGQVHNLLKSVGTEGGTQEWKVTEEGLVMGNSPKSSVFYDSGFVPRGEYDLYLVAAMTKAGDRSFLRILLPPVQGGPCWAFDIYARPDESCDAGFVPSDNARSNGAIQFQGHFGSRMRIGMASGQRLDLTFRMRTTGISVLVGGEPWFRQKRLRRVV